MAIRQTRRTISVRGDTYRRLREYAKLRARSMSEVVEEVLAREMSDVRMSIAKTIADRRTGTPEPTAPDERPRPQDVRW